MDYYDFIVPVLVIYGSCVIGIFVALSTLHAVEQTDPPKEEGAPAPPDARLRASEIASPSESGSESSEERSKRTINRPTVVNIKNEMEFFRELGKFFKQDNHLVFLLVTILIVVFTVFCHLYLHIVFSLAFCIGMADFFFSLWFSRKVFIKSVLKLDLSSNATRVCHKNWRTFIRFIFSCFVSTISSTIMSIYTLLILYSYRLGPFLQELETAGTLHQLSVLRTPNDSFLLLMAFYYVGKNLFHVLNNLWESFHMNNKVFELLTFDHLRRKSLEFYSQGFYYNVIIRIHRQAIIFSEVLVVLTVGIFQISEKISVFFVYFYALLLWYIMVFYLTTVWMFNFKTSIEATRMTIILKIGFLYYFITQFMFVYYRYFIANDLVVVEAHGMETRSTLGYAYSLMVIIFLMQKGLAYLFDPREIKTLKALNQESSNFEFFLNDKVVFKLTVALIAVYLAYLTLGFLGIFFLFFYFSIQRLFYRVKKYILVFDLYIRIMLWASRSASIHSFTFNKLLELVDKTYLQNYFLLLFMVPLFCATSNRNRHRLPDGEAKSYVVYLYASLVSFVVSILCLSLYTKLILQKYEQGKAARATAATLGENRAQLRARRAMVLTKEKLFVLFSGTALTVVFLAVSYNFPSFNLMLAVLVGLSIHLIQLIYTNKIRVKKFLNVRTRRLADDAFIVQINSELAESTSYSKSVCELSYASILLEISKVMLISYFFLSNLLRP